LPLLGYDFWSILRVYNLDVVWLRNKAPMQGMSVLLRISAWVPFQAFKLSSFKLSSFQAFKLSSFKLSSFQAFKLSSFKLSSFQASSFTSNLD
jgi:hypothetical protein